MTGKLAAIHRESKPLQMIHKSDALGPHKDRIWFEPFTPSVPKMTTILITNPRPQVICELERVRPIWDIVPMNGVLPDQLTADNTWAFIDWGTPWLPAMDVCTSLRRLQPDSRLTVVIVLSQSELQANRHQLEAAALDWILAPIDAVEIVRRVERSPAAHRPDTRRLICGDLMAVPEAHLVKAKGAIVPLGPSELSLLIHFMENRGRIWSRSELITALGKRPGDIEERTVDIWVGRMRRAIRNSIGYDVIRTVRLYGYIMDSD